MTKNQLTSWFNPAAPWVGQNPSPLTLKRLAVVQAIISRTAKELPGIAQIGASGTPNTVLGLSNQMFDLLQNTAGYKLDWGFKARIFCGRLMRDTIGPAAEQAVINPVAPVNIPA